jgi:hypothetical protein
MADVFGVVVFCSMCMDDHSPPLTPFPHHSLFEAEEIGKGISAGCLGLIVWSYTRRTGK